MWNIWHARLGHMNMDGTKRLIRCGAVVLKRDATPARYSAECSSCMKGKQKKQRLRPNMSRSPTRAVIHSDVCRPMSVESFLGCRCFVIFIDEYSRYITVILIVRKSDVRDEFIKFHAWFERKFECTIKRLHSDRGGEFMALKEYLSTNGIEQPFSPAHSPNQNPIAERANRTIVESAHSMLEHAHLPRNSGLRQWFMLQILEIYV